MTRESRQRFASWARGATALGTILLIVWTCGGTLFPERGGRERVTIYVSGFSVLAEVFKEEIFPLFREKWRAETGEDVDFADNFAASGVIANSIVNGAPTDVAILAHPGDADRVRDGRRTREWRALPNGGIVNRTPIVIAVRKGNPRRIDGFGALGRPGVKVVHPDPLTSGGAMWAILAEYAEPLVLASARGRPPAPEVAAAQLVAIWRNVVAQAPSARAARTQFEQGFGDALVTYEVETLLDVRRGSAVDVIVPAATIHAEHPVVIVDRNIRPAERAAVEAFVGFLFGREAQRAFVRHGFRSIHPELDAENPGFARLAHPYTVADLGGWERARREIVELAWLGRALAARR